MATSLDWEYIMLDTMQEHFTKVNSEEHENGEED